MAMNVGSGGGSDEPMVEMNTTPLIDVLLVLLIMLIITIPIMTHGTKLDMPQANNAPPPDMRPEVVDLEIDFDGTIVWNGTVVSGSPQVGGFFQQEAQKPVQPELHLRPDRRAKYETVALVLAAAQRRGMTKMGFVNTAEFRE